MQSTRCTLASSRQAGCDAQSDSVHGVLNTASMELNFEKHQSCITIAG